MIYMTIILLINLWLLFLIYRVDTKKSLVKNYYSCKIEKIDCSKEIQGKLDKYYINAKIAEKMAERSFTMASTASLGVIALQKALATPRYLSKDALKRNELAKREVDKIFSNDGKLEYLRDFATDEEREVLDQIIEKKMNDEINHQ